MPSLGSAIFHLRTDAKEFHAGMAAAEASAAKGVTAIGKKLNTIGRSVSRVGRTMTTRITLPIVAIGGAAIKMGMDFEKSLTDIRALVGASDEQITMYRKNILKLAKEGPIGPQELAEALYFVTSSGFAGADAIDVLRASMRAAAAGLGSTKVVADAVTSAVNAYGKENLSAARATDILLAAVREGKAEPEELAASIGRVISPAQTMGVEFHEVAGAVASLSMVGLDAAEGVTALRGVLMTILKPTKQAREFLTNAGESIQGIRKELAEKGLLPTLGRLAQKFKGNQDAIGTLFPNVRALNGMLALTGKNAGKTDKVMKGVANAMGDTDKAFKKASEDSMFKYQQAMNNLRVTLIELAPILIPIFLQLMQGISRLANAWSGLSERTQKIILIVAGVAAAIGPVLSIIGSLITAVGGVISVVGFLISPVGLVILAILGLAAVLYLAWQRSEAFRDVVTAAWEHVKAKGLELWAALQPLFAAIMDLWTSVSGLLRKHSESISSAFRAVARTVGSVLRPAFDMIVNVIKAAIQIITNIVKFWAAVFRGDWTGAWNAAKGIVSGVWNLIKAIITGAVKVIWALLKAYVSMWKAILSKGWDLIKSAASAAWEAIKAKLRGAWEAIKSTISSGISSVVKWFAGLPGRIKGALGDLSGLLVGAGMSILEGLWNGLKSKWESVKGWVGGLGSKIKGLKGPIQDDRKLLIPEGKAIGEGLLRGWILGTQDLPAKISDRTRKIVEAAQKAVERARGRLASAFRRAADMALRAFDAATQRGISKIAAKFDRLIAPLQADFETPTEKLIREMEESRELKSLEEAVTEARGGLAGKEGDELVQAQRQLNDAMYDLNLFHLRRTAESERASEQDRRDRQIAALEAHRDRAILEYEAQRELQRFHFETQLNQLEAHLTKQGATWQDAHKDLMKVFDRFGIDYQMAGQLLGKAFMRGLAQGVSGVASAASAVSGASGGPTGKPRPIKLPKLTATIPELAGAQPMNAQGGTGGLVSVQGDLIVQKEEDPQLVASMLSRKIATSRFGMI